MINNANVASAALVANQLASAVVNLAAKQVGPITSYPLEALPLADFLSLDPFVGLFKKLKKDSQSKLDAADSALSTLKGIKALTEVCAEDSHHQDMIVDFGILCLLRRFLLSDDYEKLAANEAYDASRVNEWQEQFPDVDEEPYLSDKNDPSSVRVPPTAHIRRHAARLLTILSLLPKVQKVIIADETWCKWLDDCANGKISGCHDPKMQSYARATLLNVFCNSKFNENTRSRNPSDTGGITNKNTCPRFDDMIFLINPHLPVWKCSRETDQNSTLSEDKSGATPPDNRVPTEHLSRVSQQGSSENIPAAKLPSIDVVFVHGLRGGPYKSWRIADDEPSTQSALVEKIDQEAGKLGTFWPGEWLSTELPEARMFTLKYKVHFSKIMKMFPYKSCLLYFSSLSLILLSISCDGIALINA